MQRQIQLILAALLLAGCGEKPANASTPESARTEQVSAKPATEPIDELPKSFTDHADTFDEEPTPFKMILIPGDDTKKIKPFYIAETEVTWGMFEYWMYCGDLHDEGVAQKKIAKLEAKDLRPSPLYGDLAEMFFVPDKQRPAIAMSWRTAKAYCIWLSEQTGRKYRLPTDQEWMHVFELSGGIPPTHKTLADQAVLADTGGYNKEFEPPFLDYLSRNVKSKQPNKLGLYDLLGNAAEWVEPEGDKRWVRGGHFSLKADDLTKDWRAFEDQDVWNATYPCIPVSRFWYIDHYYQGIRLVCETDTIEKD